MRFLERADLPARVGADPTVNLVDGEALCAEALLDLLDILVGDLPDALPGALEIAATGDAVRQGADEQRIEIGQVVAPDHLVVLENQKGLAMAACGHHQVGLARRFLGRERPAEGPSHAELLPFADGAGMGRALERAVGAAGETNLVAPGLTPYPTLALQLARGRRQRVGHRLPDVLAPVA